MPAPELPRIGRQKKLLHASGSPESARRLVDYLLSADVEDALASGPSGQIPLNSNARSKPPVETPATVRPMRVDFAAAAEKWDIASAFLRDEFTGAH